MKPKILRLAILLLYTLAGGVILWMWRASSFQSSTSTGMRRGFFLVSILLGTATILQSLPPMGKFPNLMSRIAFIVGLGTILAGVAMAFSWMRGY